MINKRCDQIPQQANNWAGYNLSRWCSEEYDRLHTAAQQTFDLDQQIELIRQMNDIVVEDVGIIPLLNIPQMYGVHNTLAGVDVTPWDASVWNIKAWQRVQPPVEDDGNAQ
jgi:peptide/nickel transport system substrate-binding protein